MFPFLYRSWSRTKKVSVEICNEMLGMFFSCWTERTFYFKAGFFLVGTQLYFFLILKQFATHTVPIKVSNFGTTALLNSYSTLTSVQNNTNLNQGPLDQSRRCTTTRVTDTSNVSATLSRVSILFHFCFGRTESLLSGEKMETKLKTQGFVTLPRPWVRLVMLLRTKTAEVC